MDRADHKAMMADRDDFAAARMDAVEYPIAAMDDFANLAICEL